MIKFDKNIKFGWQGCLPYDALGGSVARGAIASGFNETYNQLEYNKDGIDGKEIFKKGVLGGVTGYGINKSGQIGNSIIKNKGVIGKPTDYKLQTFKNEFEGGAGIGGATLPNYFTDNENEK